MHPFLQRSLQMAAVLAIALVGHARAADVEPGVERNSYLVAAEDCAGTVTDFLPAVRRGGRILVDGIEVTDGGVGRVGLLAERVRTQCAKAGGQVTMVVERVRALG